MFRDEFNDKEFATIEEAKEFYLYRLKNGTSYWGDYSEYYGIPWEVMYWIVNDDDRLADFEKAFERDIKSFEEGWVEEKLEDLVNEEEIDNLVDNLLTRGWKSVR